MSAVKIVTDSSAELSAEVVEELGITVVPWRLQLGTETHQDAPSYRSTEFYREATRNKIIPAPLPPDVRHMSQVYERVCGQTDDIVSVHCSAYFAKIVQSARQAQGRMLGRCRIQVVDSQYISRALGVLVEVAARAAQAGMPGAEIVRLVNGTIPSVYLAFHVEKMDHISRAGLAPNDRTEATGLSRVLLMVEDGQIVPFHRSRSRGTPVDRLIEFIAEFQRLESLYIFHSGLHSGYRDIAKRLREEMPEQHFAEHIYGPVLFNYLGPTALGIVAFEGAS
jgi:DegV family protein with EDD domain